MAAKKSSALMERHLIAFLTGADKRREMSTGCAVFVMGPAGSGKVTSHLKFQSTLCTTLIDHASNSGRSIHLLNLDPAAENFSYRPTKGICCE